MPVIASRPPPRSSGIQSASGAVRPNWPSWTRRSAAVATIGLRDRGEQADGVRADPALARRGGDRLEADGAGGVRHAEDHERERAVPDAPGGDIEGLGEGVRIEAVSGHAS